MAVTDFYIDIRNINKITEMNKFPLPRIGNVLESLHECEYFTSLDLKSGYSFNWQIPIKREHQLKTAFATNNNTYCFLKMLMGLSCSAATL